MTKQRCIFSLCVLLFQSCILNCLEVVDDDLIGLPIVRPKPTDPVSTTTRPPPTKSPTNE